MGIFDGPGFGAYGGGPQKSDTPICLCCGPNAPFRCLKCHFDYEEKYAIQHLPPKLQERLKGEHKVIIAQMRRGFLPLKLIKAHRELEGAIFPIFLPPAMNKSLEKDHSIYGKVLFCDSKLRKKLYM